MTARMTRLGAIVLAAALVLSGCARGHAVDETLSLRDAKAFTQSVEREIVDALPTDRVVVVDQKLTGTLMMCSRDSGEQWAGGVNVVVAGDPEPEELLSPIAEQFSGRASFRVRSREDNGDALVDVMGEYGAIWIVRYNRPEAQLLITSASPCFRLPDGVWSGGSH